MAVAIILYGNKPQLQAIRAQLLMFSGFLASCVSSLSGAAALVSERNVKLMILCHTLTELERRKVVELCGRLWPDLPVISLISSESRRTDSGITLNVFDGPQALINLCKRLVEVPLSPVSTPSKTIKSGS